jgi:hypothetical protein
LTGGAAFFVWTDGLLAVAIAAKSTRIIGGVLSVVLVLVHVLQGVLGLLAGRIRAVVIIVDDCLASAQAAKSTAAKAEAGMAAKKAAERIGDHHAPRDARRGRQCILQETAS